MSTERAPINVLLRSEQSGEQIAVMDNSVSAGFPGPPCNARCGRLGVRAPGVALYARAGPPPVPPPTRRRPGGIVRQPV